MLRLKIIFLLLFAFSCAVFSQEYWYGSIDLSDKSSRNYYLEFGFDTYQLPDELRYVKVDSKSHDKMEIINKFEKKGWELIKLDENTLYFRYDMEQAVKTQKYWYGSIDLSDKSSRSYYLEFGFDTYQLPDELRYVKVDSKSHDKMEIINKFEKKGWEYPAELQYGDSLLIFRFALQEKKTVKEQRYWLGSIDLSDKSSRSYYLEFGFDTYQLPDELRYVKVDSKSHDKMEIINKFEKKGWELIKLDENTLYFRYDMEQAVKSQKYWYGSTDLSDKSSRNYYLEFGFDTYQLPDELRYVKVDSKSHDKMEIINKFEKKGWELIKLDENTLYFRYDMEQAVKSQKYWYGSIDLSDKSSSSYYLEFGFDSRELPDELRYVKVDSNSHDKMEIINKLQKKGWEYPAELQYGDSLLIFRMKLNK